MSAYTRRELLANCPGLKPERVLVGRHDFPSFPMRFSAGPHTYWSGPAPMLGEHTDTVLREIGVTDPELDRLRATHVIGTTPLTPG